MLGIAHTLSPRGCTIATFLDRYCVGFERFDGLPLGRTDGQAKDAAWASRDLRHAGRRHRALARRMAGRRTPSPLSHSLQRAEHGEQPVWMGLVLAAMLGQIGLPGGGFGYASARSPISASPRLRCRSPTLPQGRNA